MSTQPQTTTGRGPHPEDLSKAAARALTEPMTVVEDGPETWDDNEVAVYSSSGETYVVNPVLGFCECPADQYHDGPCKHRHRAAFALGHREIPSWVDRERVDDVLLNRLEDDATATQETHR